MVLSAQSAAINEIKPGKHWNEPHDAAVRVLTEGMVELGILKGDPEKLIKNDDYTKYFMHRTGHWLGMDVHDVGDYKLDGEWRMLEAGMVMTVEPGLYLPANSESLLPDIVIACHRSVTKTHLSGSPCKFPDEPCVDLVYVLCNLFSGS